MSRVYHTVPSRHRCFTLNTILTDVADPMHTAFAHSISFFSFALPSCNQQRKRHACVSQNWGEHNDLLKKHLPQGSCSSPAFICVSCPAQSWCFLPVRSTATAAIECRWESCPAHSQRETILGQSHSEKGYDYQSRINSSQGTPEHSRLLLKSS